MKFLAFVYTTEGVKEEASIEAGDALEALKLARGLFGPRNPPEAIGVRRADVAAPDHQARQARIDKWLGGVVQKDGPRLETL